MNLALELIWMVLWFCLGWNLLLFLLCTWEVADFSQLPGFDLTPEVAANLSTTKNCWSCTLECVSWGLHLRNTSFSCFFFLGGGGRAQGKLCKCSVCSFPTCYRLSRNRLRAQGSAFLAMRKYEKQDGYWDGHDRSMMLEAKKDSSFCAVFFFCCVRFPD